MASEFDKILVKGELNTDPETAQIPLNPEYLTPDGWYAAGYWWGSQARNVDVDAPTCEVPEEFLQGARDGFGDWQSVQPTLDDSPKESPFDFSDVVDYLNDDLYWHELHKSLTTKIAALDSPVCSHDWKRYWYIGKRIDRCTSCGEEKL
jgi:hypothetical protein